MPLPPKAALGDRRQARPRARATSARQSHVRRGAVDVATCSLPCGLAIAGMNNAEEAKRAAQKACDVALAKAGKSSVEALNNHASQFPLLRYIQRRFEEWAPGISCMGGLLVSTACLNMLTGPVEATLITSVRDDGTQATWSQPAGDFYLFGAPCRPPLFPPLTIPAPPPRLDLVQFEDEPL